MYIYTRDVLATCILLENSSYITRHLYRYIDPFNNILRNDIRDLFYTVYRLGGVFVYNTYIGIVFLICIVLRIGYYTILYFIIM